MKRADSILFGEIDSLGDFLTAAPKAKAPLPAKKPAVSGSSKYPWKVRYNKPKGILGKIFAPITKPLSVITSLFLFCAILGIGLWIAPKVIRATSDIIESSARAYKAVKEARR